MSAPEPIAIVGVGCRFPGDCNTPSKLWNLICEKRDVQRRIDPSRFNMEAFYHQDGDRPGCTNSPYAYLMNEDISTFDAGFFKMNATEVEATDPQQRLLLETVYEALESAGLRLEDLRGSDTACFVGSMTGDYHEMQLRDPTDMPKYLCSGTARSILSNRISYFYDWHGPSMTIDTACSSSLVCVDSAVQALRSGVSRTTCAAGTNIILGPEIMISESKVQMLSPTGRSRMWDAGADGYARGEGIGALVLKTLSDAIKDGDEVYCIIRETGVNSDGHTQGISMPSAEAQAALMRETYRRAGLDPVKDRPQYFQAHGTGTQAGDPQEARAIYNAFYPEGSDRSDRIWVGSVKTVIGHLEGCAGIAGVITAAEAVRRAIIPPNMLFQKLNPAIEPYSGQLRVPVNPRPWPTLASGASRRASVNSFGFGGTNAHAIIESFDAGPEKMNSSRQRDFLPSPLTLSANSESSLKGQMTALADFVETHEMSLPDLLYTVQTRRTQHPIRTFVSTTRKSDLIQHLRASAKTSSNVGIQVLNTPSQARIVGVFTGQGAQYQMMGREILLTSARARMCFSNLEASLASLHDAPEWKLSDQVLGMTPSRLDEAVVAQPLTTAIQILVVDMLAEAGIHLNTVVGHSSGEIAAAYAVGALSAHDAIRVAYYRGLYATLARSGNGQRGGMMAVGLSYDDACDLCDDQYAGRVDVAAWNSDTSTTLSGDEDAIREIQAELEARDVFARILKVDTAYHSHHMAACSQHYAKALKACAIKPEQLKKGCKWFSSVLVEPIDGPHLIDRLSCDYWVENLLGTVLFREAVELSCHGDLLCHVGIEIGPHPALRAPFTQTYQRTMNFQLPYHGTLTRGRDAVESLGETLGFLWTQLGADAVNFCRYNTAFLGNESKPRLVRLPNYSWQHDKSFWRESRKSRNFRTREQRLHPLLGVRAVDDLEEDKRWENVLRVKDLPWLAGHSVSGNVVFPAAAYLVMAVQASKSLSRGQSIALFELHDVEIGNAMLFEDNETSIHTTFSLRTTSLANATSCSAEWSCHSVARNSHAPWRLNAKGHIKVTLGEHTTGLLPPRQICARSLLNEVNADDLYDSVSKLGLTYTGVFRRLECVLRRSGFATAETRGLETQDHVHPALLDAAFQVVFPAYAYPGDGALTSPYVPTEIQSIRFVGSRQCASGHDRIVVDATLTDSNARALVGDIELFSPSGEPLMQLQGMKCTALSGADYKELYTTEQWELDIGSGLALVQQPDAPRDLLQLEFLERLAYSYLRKFNASFSKAALSSLEWHSVRMLEWVEHLLSRIQSGHHPTIRAEWASDCHEELLKQAALYDDQAVVQLVRTVGDNLAAAARKETSLLEHMMKDSLLERAYSSAPDMRLINAAIGRLARQIAHRHPRMKILEVGGGTGSATAGMLDALGTTFASYEFTDVSTGFLESAARRFDKWAQKMSFRTLDIGEDVVKQGYQENGYDLIVAANVLHVTKSIQFTLSNVRRLLRPGGYLLLLEVTGENVARRFAFAGLPGFWLSEDGRQHGPMLDRSQWHVELQEAGFSGIDSFAQDFVDDTNHVNSVMVSQALDPDIEILRSPLTASTNPLEGHDVTVIGGNIDQLGPSVIAALTTGNNKAAICLINRLEDLADQPLASSSVILLEDQPVLEEMSAQKLKALQNIMSHCRQLLWVGHSSLYGSMSVGLLRSLDNEYLHVRTQYLHACRPVTAELPHYIAEAMARLCYASGAPQSTAWLWTIERELKIDWQGRVSILRVLLEKEANDRFNATKLPITNVVSLDRNIVTVTRLQDKYCVTDTTTFEPVRDSEESPIVIRVSYALLEPLQVEGASRYLCYGHIAGRGNEAVVAISETCSSQVRVLPSDTISASSIRNPGSAISRLARELTLRRFLDHIDASKTLVVHEPDPPIGMLLLARAAERGIKTVALSSTQLPGSIHVHPIASDRALRRVLPTNTGSFVNLADHENARWQHILPSDCCYVTTEELWHLPLQRSHIATVVASDDCCSISNFEGDRTTTVTELASTAVASAAPSTVVDFSTATKVDALVSPIAVHSIVRGDGTYFLVGCTGGLGRVLASWLVANGARYLALISRNASAVDPAWLAEIRSKGARVQLCQADVADMEMLRCVHQEIAAAMPPVIGVVNAAMVLSDKSFERCTVEDFDAVFRPKVNGTLNLHTLFGAAPLDFFVMFSSLGAIFGSPGQTNYVAANHFMLSIAEERRSKGLCASVLHIGLVIGVGYVMQSGRLDAMNKNYDYPMPLSEHDFVSMFAQAVIVGQANSDHPAALITGIPRYDMDGDLNTRYRINPKFSHRAFEHSVSRSELLTTTVSVRNTVAGADSKEEAALLVQDAFCARLEKMLQTNTIDPAQSLMNVGVDSLVAVEIRSWFLKELEVDIPVLKILGGGSVVDICREAASKFMTSYNKVVAAVEVNGTSPESLSTSTDPCDSRGSRTGMNGSSVQPRKPNSVGVEREGPLSYSQKLVWNNIQLLQDPTLYNLTVCYKFPGQLDAVRLERAFQAVIDRHEILRTRYSTDAATKEPRQYVMARKAFRIHIDPDFTPQAAFDDVLKYPFPLEEGESFRVCLVQLEHEAFMALACHHIAFDNFSSIPLLRDMGIAYSGGTFEPLKYQYLEYVAEEDQRPRSDLEEDLAYWKDIYQQLPEPLPLFDFCKVKTRPPVGTPLRRPQVQRIMSVEMSGTVKHAARTVGATPFHVFLSALSVLLHRMLSSQDLCLGVISANRNETKFNDLVGSFGDLIAIRSQLTEPLTMDFAQMVSNTRQIMHDALSHARVPFGDVVQALQVPKTNLHMPLYQFQVNHVYNSGQTISMSGGEMDGRLAQYQRTGARSCDFDMEIQPLDDGRTLLTMRCRHDLYREEDIKLLLAIYEQLLISLVRDVTQRVAEVPIPTVRDVDLNSYDTCPVVLETWDV